MSGMHIEETRAIGYEKFWKISFVLYSSTNFGDEELYMKFFDKWTKSPIGNFPYKISAGKVLRISFSDKSIPDRRQYNHETKQYKSYKTYMTQQDVDEYKAWFYDLCVENLGMKI
tara:strand:+ start:546 stop:890 length:345 start_codon:yes stop_codon:yes gene_type:complete